MEQELKPYNGYEPANLSWLSKIPSNWEIKRVSILFDEQKVKNSNYEFKNAFQFKFGEIVEKKQVGTVEELKETYEKYTIVQPNDIVINGLNLNYDFVTQRVGLVQKAGIITSAYISISPREYVNPKYACYLFKSMDNIKMLNGMGTGIRLTLSFGELKKHYIPYPKLTEQDQIIKFLDFKASKINRFIKEKKREIELLKELKRAEINIAVTKGLNPNAPMKVTGISWLGEIPENWDLKRAKTMFEKANRPVEDYHETITCFRDGEVTLRKNRRTTGFTESFKEIGYQGIKTGDLVIHQMDAFAGAVGVSDSDGKGTPVYSVCIPKSKDFNNYFYALIIREMANTGFIQSLYRGIRERSSDFRFETFARQYLPIPSRQEQDEILTYINEKTTKIDGFIRKLNQEISLAQEYKTSLISEVVTGIVDVRNVKVDEIIEEETWDESDTEVEAEELIEE